MSLNYQRHSDFPGSPVVKNLLGNVGGTDSIPGLGRFHTLRGNQAHAPQLEKIPHMPQLSNAAK